MQLRSNFSTYRVAAKACNVKFAAVALLALASLLLIGWRDRPATWVPLPDPADPRAPAPGVGYRSTIAPYKRQRPVEPGPWGEQNQRVTPQPKSGP
jgi:hypothetical protein